MGLSQEKRRALLPSHLYFSDFSDWPLFEGVQTLYFSWAGEIATTPPMLSGGRAPTGETAVAMGKFGAGHVLVVGDTNFCENDFLPSSNNQLFTEHLFDALSVVTVPTLSPLALIVFLLMLMGCGLQLTPLRVATGETRILWDASHGIYRNSHLAGSYSDLAALLALKNQFLEERNEGLLNLDLSSYDAMVVNLAANWYTPYTAEEVIAITHFVEQGGNLLIMIDNHLTPLENLDQLAAVFGASFPRVPLFPEYLYFSDFSDWPLFEGVQTLHFPWAGQIATTPPMLSGGRAPTGETAEAMGKYGAGHVLVVDDTNFAYAGAGDRSMRGGRALTGESAVAMDHLPQGLNRRGCSQCSRTRCFLQELKHFQDAGVIRCP